MLPQEGSSKTGEPVAMALRKGPDLFLARPDFRLYEVSKAFMDICMLSEGVRILFDITDRRKLLDGLPLIIQEAASEHRAEELLILLRQKLLLNLR